MSAAVRLVRDWAFDELELERLELTTDVDNIGSQRVAAAAGFRREGVLRGYLAVRGRRTDDVLFGMVRTDPREPAPAPFGAARLTDGRVVVRPFEAADVPAVRAACLDPAVAHWIYGVPLEYSLADAEAFIADSWRCLAAGTRARLAVAEAAMDGDQIAAGRLLGSISLDLYPRAARPARSATGSRRRRRRQGVAAAAVRLVMHWGFEIVGLERLEIMTYPGNAASQALAAQGRVPPRGPAARLPRGRARQGAATGRVEPAADGSLPPRDDQVLFALARGDWRG